MQMVAMRDAVSMFHVRACNVSGGCIKHQLRLLNAGKGTTKSMKLAVIGDVHDEWSQRDAAALKHLDVDMALFVGDFGNEAVELVASIAKLDLPKAVILGNHDAWYTMVPRQRRLPMQTQSASEMLQYHERTGSGASNGVQQQLRLLGDSHVGYSAVQCPEKAVSIVGARPFSRGGKNFGPCAPFYNCLYGINSLKESEDRIVQVALQQPVGNSLVFLAHSGPAGFGAKPWDICGVDWEKRGGDHGDLDLQAALAELHSKEVHVPLVVFGHMHHVLKGGKAFRRMVHVDGQNSTVYLNAATVPRVKRASKHPMTTNPMDPSVHHFMLVDLGPDGDALTAKNIWAKVQPLDSGADPEFTVSVVEEQPVLRTIHGSDGTVKFHYDAHDDRWVPTVMASRHGALPLEKHSALLPEIASAAT